MNECLEEVVYEWNDVEEGTRGPILCAGSGGNECREERMKINILCMGINGLQN